ncbi:MULTISPECIES: FliM/FliN family flagellar motor switch protein [Hyphomicrobiales]|jgi:flagellar motor switch protein FliN/FliY|uniref:Flagellar motor switch protein FliN n=2 Tax=Prosthecodimorpha TaxID=2981530 RepID=A0A0P6VZ95_9HYPH|nr:MULTISPECIES: FliM/FliN family flagellar motor switch protein [Hyphomicrobiales]KPL51123.1 flagellar motor switch protein FliN [Prosthecomicrobium hirschii]MBT9293189.1 flagellar motor switch protein FliN [Prosthecodimorpha staleyi]MCW1839027.1 FliM/FliN family flagellar motor switch protein [Prosthecomicrobium hirschii]TPQ48882.1 flagellar motor switch protein FliN [Prosthecomicrobium hirschii]
MTPFDNIPIDISVQLGTTMIPIHQLLRMGRGAVIELDTRESDEVTILANNVPVASGQVILRGDRIGISITEVLFRAPTARAKEAVKRL